MKKLLALSQIAYNAYAASSGEGLEVYDGFNINLTLIDAETIQFDVVMKADTWIGFTLGGLEMDLGTDFLRCIAAGQNSRFRDEHIRRPELPGIDFINNFEGTFTDQGDEVVFQLTRSLNTGDSLQDFVIPLDSDFGMAWYINTAGNNVRQSYDVKG